jgi:hypothetical protein
VAQEYRRSALLTELMRCATAYMLEVQCDRAIATVSPNHSSFYEFVGFEQLGAERSYSQKLHDPVVALCGDLSLLDRAAPSFSSSAEEYVFNFMSQAHRLRDQAAEWSHEAKLHFLSADLLKGLLLSQRNFLAECSLSELFHLRNSWGGELFDVVWASSSTELFPGPALSSAPAQNRSEGSNWMEFKEVFWKYFAPDFSWLCSPQS